MDWYDEQVQVLRSSHNFLVSQLVKKEPAPAMDPRIAAMTNSSRNAKSTIKSNRKTVGSQFRESLSLLVQTLNSTTPHYIRCIKPNDDKAPFTIQPARAVQQLRACGNCYFYHRLLIFIIDSSVKRSRMIRFLRIWYDLMNWSIESETILFHSVIMENSRNVQINWISLPSEFTL